MTIERTLVIIKPDAIERKLARKILTEYVHPLGVRICAMDIFQSRTEELDRKVALHYNKDDAWCLKYGTKKREMMARDWESEISGTLPSALEFGHDIRSQLYDAVASGSIIILVLEGGDVVVRMRDLIGATDPINAAKGTIRGDLREFHVSISAPAESQAESIAYAQKSNRAVRNLIHASDSPEEAVREISIWFPNLK